MKTGLWTLPLSCFVLGMTAVILSGCGTSAELTREYDTLPKLREYVPPVYPERIWISQESAVVLLRLRVDEEGSIRGVTVVKSSGDAALDSAAVGASKKWKYYPATKGGKPVPIAIQQEIIFSTKPAESTSFY